jgi:hypothetical protein
MSSATTLKGVESSTLLKARRKLQRLAQMERRLSKSEFAAHDSKARAYGAFCAYWDAIRELDKAMGK